MFINLIRELIYPPKCGFCGQLNKNYICKKCELELQKGHRSEILNKEDLMKQSELGEIYFDYLIHVFRYETIIRKKLIAYKFYECSYLYKSIVNFLLKDKKIVEKIEKYDTIIPVPISTKRYNDRGYNQSGLITKEIAKNINIVHEDKVLKKVKNIVAQSTLNKEERKNNIQGAYKVEGDITNIIGKKILLVDDIYTTGSTINEICKELQKCNPQEIGILVIAKD